jgi:hypothetical protein
MVVYQGQAEINRDPDGFSSSVVVGTRQSTVADPSMFKAAV